MDPNRELLLLLGLLHRGGDHPWGAELGASWLFALGDHCSWSEDACRRSDWWPVVGPRVAATWTGGPRVGMAVEGLGGIEQVDMHQFGFVPQTGLLAGVGADIEWGALPALTVGGTAVRTLSWTDTDPIPGVPDATSSRTYGPHQLSLAFGLRARWRGEWLGPGWDLSLQTITEAADYL